MKLDEEPLRIFLGYDRREAAGYHACVQSIIEHASVLPMIAPVFGDRRDGSNDFIYARFLVPLLCGFKGWAIFADGSDMLFREDIAKLWALRPLYAAVAVVKREYKTRSPRKYLGSALEAPNEDYPRKNWSSLIIWNCGHYANRKLTQEFVASSSGSDLHRFSWLPSDHLIAELPSRWNVLIGEEGEEEEDCAVAHFTLGIPALSRHYAHCKYAEEWREALFRATWIGEGI